MLVEICYQVSCPDLGLIHFFVSRIKKSLFGSMESYACVISIIRVSKFVIEGLSKETF